MVVEKGTEHQRRTLAAMVGKNSDEAMLNSEEIKPVAIAIIELHLSKNIISQTVNQ